MYVYCYILAVCVKPCLAINRIHLEVFKSIEYEALNTCCAFTAVCSSVQALLYTEAYRLIYATYVHHSLPLLVAFRAT